MKHDATAQVVVEAPATVASQFDEEELGRLIRELRKKRGLSLRELAGTSGVSVSFLSQVERGATSPSIASLMRIAQALGRTIGSLLEPKTSSRLVRKNEAPRLVHSGGDWDEALLTPREFSQLQVIRSTIAPAGSTGDELIVYETAETAMIIEQGAIEVDLDGEIMQLWEGDCLSFDPSVPHRFTNRSRSECVILFASAPPTY
ncbi:helix-turn-helix domain-containing protein [Ruicaihuangia caeni]|uniref:Helix-turn-helix domain-containing protein n=1 Tax=Ruicaihuangia caeni TaxID=3042517 RepID=A0AAW6T6L0_9MICO|nr:helix-turn-helix domain-containing protein [Klugiella sp. YN-L-19]MDI2099134.1 helix-turn-helix domain-containing protein [Klugiella sp. YN-L-19]